jgi:hypothetical protein
MAETVDKLQFIQQALEKTLHAVESDQCAVDKAVEQLTFLDPSHPQSAMEEAVDILLDFIANTGHSRVTETYYELIKRCTT